MKKTFDKDNFIDQLIMNAPTKMYNSEWRSTEPLWIIDKYSDDGLIYHSTAWSIKTPTFITYEDFQKMVSVDGGIDAMFYFEVPTLDEIARPVLAWLCENFHPHVTVIITPTSAELMEGKVSTGPILDYVKD